MKITRKKLTKILVAVFKSLLSSFLQNEFLLTFLSYEESAKDTRMCLFLEKKKIPLIVIYDSNMNLCKNCLGIAHTFLLYPSHLEYSFLKAWKVILLY